MIALRLNFTDVIRDNSLKNIYVNGKKAGCQFDIMLSYYRGHFLSAIDELRVLIDGEEIAPEDITFTLHGQDYFLAQLETLGDVFWPVAEPATIKVFKNGGFESGEHEIELVLIFRSPYMELAPGLYMPNDGGDKKRLVLEVVSSNL